MEKWKYIDGYEGLYMVSNKGRVKSLDRKVNARFGKFAIKKGRLLKNVIKKNIGYEAVSLSKKNKRVQFCVHALVANAFLGKRPDGYCVNHKDEIKTNNNVENLEYITISKNFNYGTAKKRRIDAISAPIISYDLNLNNYKRYPSISSIDREGYFSRSSVNRVLHGRQIHTKGYIFEYEDK